MTKNIQKRIDQLRKEINKHNRLYYNENTPKISDSVYDKLVKELKKLEERYPMFALSDSPTKTVGAPVQEGFAKVQHTAPMLSLESVNTEDECRKFHQNCMKELGKDKVEYVCEPKLDGLSVELVYEKGEFVRGATRGDGAAGEDVTSNLKAVKNVPKKLKGDDVPDVLAVRGEVLIHIKDFNALNKKQENMGKSTFANPRNAAAGSLRQLDASITAGRNLDVYCYRILKMSGEPVKTHQGMIKKMVGLGLKSAPGTEVTSDIEEVIKYHHNMESGRDELDYEVDGIVVKVNDIADQTVLGMRTNNPKWAVAYKFEARKEVTKVEDIVVQVGRTGVLTPVALLKPVEVGGVTVARATLHNMDEVTRLDVKVGDYVRIERAGDVIPKVTEVIKEKRTGKEKPAIMPDKCPSCGAIVVKEDVFYRCPDGLSCPAQIKEAIKHFASKGAADIEGLSVKTVEQLYDEGIINTISDLYTMDRGAVLGLEGWKKKKTDNLFQAIERSKGLTLDRFIYGLGIRNVGKHIARVLAMKYGSIDSIAEADLDDLVTINEIGPEIAESINMFLNEPGNREVIKKFKSFGIDPKMTVTAGGKFEGMKFVFTGSLKSMSRSEAAKIVEDAGGQVQSAVSKETDIVVAGEKAGSKLEKARKLDVKVITEDEFKAMI